MVHFRCSSGFHGYGENAEHMLDDARADPRRPAVAARERPGAQPFLHARDNDVVANWMTREDRELAIADNLAYVGSVVAAVRARHPDHGHARLCRLLARRRDGLSRARVRRDLTAPFPPAAAGSCSPATCRPTSRLTCDRFPPLLIGRGRADDWYTGGQGRGRPRSSAAAAASPRRLHVFEGGHVWDRVVRRRPQPRFLDLRSTPE